MNEAKTRARILVVDDEDRNRRLLVAMLEAEGYAAAEAVDGAQALDLARQSPPDLILLDIIRAASGAFAIFSRRTGMRGRRMLSARGRDQQQRQRTAI